MGYRDWLGVPKISPYHNLSLDPSTIVFHYAFELFEGMKAYRDKQGNIRTFRGDKNMARMNKSAERIALPQFDGEELQKLIDQLLILDQDFVPEGKGYSFIHQAYFDWNVCLFRCQYPG